MGYLDNQGNYYEGDRISPDDVEASPPPVQNYQGFAAALRGTSLFGKVYFAAKQGDSTIQTPLSLLTSTLNSINPIYQDFYFAMVEIKASMGDRLSSSDIAAVNQILAANNFTFTL